MRDLCEKYKSYFVRLTPMRCYEGDLVREPTLNKGMPSRILSTKRTNPDCGFVRIIVGVDIITGKKGQTSLDGWRRMIRFRRYRIWWEVIDIQDDQLTLMERSGTQRSNLKLSTQNPYLSAGIRRAWESGSHIVRVGVLSGMLGLDKLIDDWEGSPVPRRELFEFLTADPSTRFKYFKNALKHEGDKRKDKGNS